MAPIELPCTVGDRDCDFKTLALEFDQAKVLLDSHLQYKHGGGAAGPAGGGGKKPEKFPRPEVKLDSSAEDWSEFEVTWAQYKEEYNLAGPGLIRQLYACCSDELKTSLSRITGGQQFVKSEADLLKLMKQLSVKYQNPAVHVQEFLGVTQQVGEGVRHFLTRLRGVASRCNFTEKCTVCDDSDVSYADSIIRFKLIAGLLDAEIKEDILSSEDKNLEETVKAIEAKESGKAARKVIGVQGVPSVSSSAVTETPPPHSNCSFCGRAQHSQDREKSCPAWGKKCGKCGKLGHFQAVCRSKNGQNKFSKSRKVSEVEAKENGDSGTLGAVGHDDSYFMFPGGGRVLSVEFGEMAGLMYSMAKVNKEVQSLNKAKMPHMLYQQLEWVTRHPPAQPLIKLAVNIDTEAYHQNKLKPPSAYKHREADLVALADSGCQATVMGPLQLSQLGLSSKDLIEVQLTLSGANRSSIKILGAVFVNISGADKGGQLWTTRQLCYVAEGVDKVLLSREACSQLGMLSDSFPAVGCAAMTADKEMKTEVLTASAEYDLVPCTPSDDGSCQCPRREDTPEPPVFDPTKSADELKSMIIRHYAASAFNRCTRQTLPLMRGEPLPIPTKPDIKPTAVHTPIPVPLHWRDKVKKDLDRDVALGVIEEVPINSPVSWVSRMIVVPKHNGEPRRTVDLQALNRASVRQTHPTESPFKLASAVPAGKVKSVLDVWNSFHSVPIRECDRDKTCFITPWARYRYKVSPQGYLGSMDGYTHRFSIVTKDIPDKVVIVDDTLLYSDDLEKNFYDVCKLLGTCHKNGLIFNADKFQFGQQNVQFAGLEVTENGVKPSRKFLDGIGAFPRPESLTEARSFFGMINQVSYSFAASAVMEPFRHLLKPETWKSGFKWTDELSEKFDLAKKEIIRAVTDGVRQFDVDRWTCLATDWSRQGIGFFLMQKYCKCENLHPSCCKGGWKLVLAGGRFTKPAESRYSPVEGELLGVVDALHKCRHFVLGCSKLIVAVDHKPLLGLLNDKSLADIQNPRLLMLKEKTLWFQFQVIHVPGRINSGPDYLSRIHYEKDVMTTKETRLNAVLSLVRSMEDAAEENVTINDIQIIDSVVASLSSLPVQAITFEAIREEVKRDREMQILIGAITNKSDAKFPEEVFKYDRHREELSVVDGVPMFGRRAIVPAALRRKVLDSLHSAHQCPVKMIERAKHTVFWPGIVGDIENTRKNCSFCDRNAPSQPMMPPLPIASPNYPFEQVVADYFDIKGKAWLVIADRFSGWLSVYYYPRQATSSDLIKSMKEYFCTFGVAEQFSSDDGPQFRSHNFKQFLKTWGVAEHRVSSAYNPHSNLRAETAVRSSKRILMDNTKSDGSPDWDRVTRALMNHRNTPDSEYGLSPSQLVFGRPIKDFLPVKPGAFSPSEVWVDCREKRELAMRQRVLRGAEKWTEHTRSLKPLQLGEKVIVQNQYGAGKIAKKWDRTGQVVEDLGYNKYRIRIDGSGRVSDRNRQYLRKFTPFTSTLPGPKPQTFAPLQPDDYSLQEEATPTVAVPPSHVSNDAPGPVVDDSAPTPEIEPEPNFVTPPSSPEIVTTPLKRSSRERVQYKPFNIRDTKTQSYNQ